VRWGSAESFAIHARLNPPEYAGWVSKALLQRTDSTSTRNFPRLPLIDDFDIFATFSHASEHFQRAGRQRPRRVTALLLPQHRFSDAFPWRDSVGRADLRQGARELRSGTRPAGAGGPQFCSLICLKSPTSERLLVVPWWWFGLREKGRKPAVVFRFWRVYRFYMLRLGAVVPVAGLRLASKKQMSGAFVLV
jgi:hypothetical protein